ncbi:Uncharacterised protein [Achromobacter xylosoxidans]|nr:Uncharacterised protein [Achromobacter xylosoxidans]
MHQRGQRDVRMPGHFDLQRRRAVGAQPLRQLVGQARGLGRVVGVLVLLVGGFAFGAAEAAPQLFQRAQRLGLGFAQQAAMNNSLAVAVDGDDGTGHLAHFGGVALQGILRVLQFSDHLIAPLFQLLGLGLVLGVAGFFQFGVDLFEAGFQRGDAAGLAGGRLAAVARGVLERLPFLVGQMRHGLHPCPALGAHVLGQRCQLVAHERFQHCGIGEVGSGIAFREQVAADAAACLPVGVQPDEAHQRVRGVDFALGQALAQLGRAALPFRRTIERGFLRGVVVGEGTQQDRPLTPPTHAGFRQAERAGTDQRAGPEAPAMEARQGRDSRSEAQCAARQRDGGTPGRPTAWDRTTRCRSCAARCATVLDVQPGVVAKVQRVVLLIGRCQVHHHQEGGGLLLDGDALAHHIAGSRA